MTENNQEALACGETKVCDSCELLQTNPELATLGACRRKNQKGYCDFYEGPDKKIHTIGNPSG